MESDVHHLVRCILHWSDKTAPSTSAILCHPCFWSVKEIVEFLLLADEFYDLMNCSPAKKLKLDIIDYNSSSVMDMIEQFGLQQVVKTHVSIL